MVASKETRGLKDCEIDTSLIPIKALYFLYYGGLSSFIPYKSIYQKQLGMSTAQNGLIQAIMQLVSLFSPPIAGLVTDKTKAYKMIIGSLFFFSVAFTIPFYFVPSEDSTYAVVNVDCCLPAGEFSSVVCKGNASVNNHTICSADRNMSVVMDSGMYADCTGTYVNCTLPSKPTDTYGITFALLVAFTALMSFFLAPMTPLLDSSAMDTLGRERVSRFGAQRLWGAVGFGIVGLGVSYLTDVISPVEIYGPYSKNYLVAFCSVVVFWIGALVVMVTSVKISAPKAKGILRGLKLLLVKIEILFFLFIVLVSGFATGVQYSYLFWYLQDFDDFGQLILGLSVLITCLSEIPMFWISGWICQTFGYVSVLSIGLCAVSIRFFVYSVITNAWQILAVEWLHGISFALPMTAMCSYATVVAPKDAVATLISFSQTVYWGIGNMLGALCGGLLYQHFGATVLFRVTAIICFSCAFLYWICLGPFGVLGFCKSDKGLEGVVEAGVDKKAECDQVYEEKLLKEEPAEV